MYEIPSTPSTPSTEVDSYNSDEYNRARDEREQRMLEEEVAAAADIFNDAERDWEEVRDMEWDGGAVMDILWG